MIKPTIINVDTEKLQRLFNELTEASLEKYSDEAWKLYYEGFGDAIAMYKKCIGSYKEEL